MIQKNKRRRYVGDLSDSQWTIIEPLFPKAGNRSKWEKREPVDALLYFVDNGYKWRKLPHDFPPYTTLTNFFMSQSEAAFEREFARHCRNEYGQMQDLNAGPGYAIIDSQSVKITLAAEGCESNGGKNKRTQTAHYSRYHGKSADGSGLFGPGVYISIRIKPKWEILPKRWIVERSLAWLNNFRRLSKDYEVSVRSAQTVCVIVAFHILLKRF